MLNIDEMQELINFKSQRIHEHFIAILAFG